MPRNAKLALPDTPLKCGSCKQMYSSDSVEGGLSNRMPVLLQCLHRFCRECCTKGYSEGFTTCPQLSCKRKTKGHPTNLVVDRRALFMAMNPDQGQPISSKCEFVCVEGKEGETTHFCDECSCWLCADCLAVHNMSTRTKQHVVVTLAEYKAAEAAATARKLAQPKHKIFSTSPYSHSSPLNPLPHLPVHPADLSTGNGLSGPTTMHPGGGSDGGAILPGNMCPVHGKPLEMFCDTCRILVCLKCALLKHAGHSVVEIEPTATKYHALLAADLALVKKKIPDLLEAQFHVNEALIQVPREKDAAVLAVTEHCRKLRNAISTCEERMLKEATAAAAAKTAALFRQHRTLSELTGRAASTVQYADWIRTEGGPTSFLEAAPLLSIGLAELVAEPFSRKPETSGSIRFLPDARGIGAIGSEAEQLSTYSTIILSGTVSGSLTDASKCTVVGKPFANGGRSGKEVTFEVLTFAHDGRPRTTNDEPVQMHLTFGRSVRPTTEADPDGCRYKTEWLGDGRYRCSFVAPDDFEVPECEGSLSITISGVGIAGSPFKMQFANLPAWNESEILGMSTDPRGSTLLQFIETSLPDFPPENTKLELLYRATKDGWDPASGFHAKCDGNLGPTVTVIRVPAPGNARRIPHHIFGGIMPLPWSEHESRSTRSCLFGLGCHGDKAPRRIPLKKDKSQTGKHRTFRDCGPVFGDDGAEMGRGSGSSSGSAAEMDLILSNDPADFSKGHSCLGNAYELPSATISQTRSVFLTGSTQFEADEYEVFAVMRYN